MVIIKQLSRQDRHSTRNSEELRRRYQFKDIDYTREEIERLKLQVITDDHLSIESKNPIQNKVVTQALNDKINRGELNGKVDKEEGKGLSSNDFTDEEKSKVAANTAARHTHSNKDLLDSYTQTEANLKNAVDNTHTHSNKTVLDTFTKTEEEILNTIAGSSHSHSNKTVLDSYTQTEANLKKAVDNTHTHDNKTVLDSYTKTEEELLNEASKIIESGSNDNGNYIKYSDGTMICFNAYTPDTQDTTYHYYSGTWNFPIAFVKMPLVIGTADSWNTAMASVKIRATETNCRVMLHFLALNTIQPVDTTCAINLVAIGKWK